MDRVNWLTGPSFLDCIDAGIVGFGGGAFLLSFFGLMAYKRLGKELTILVVILLYGLSIGTGIGLDGTVSDRASAFIAGFWAPMIYGTIFTVLVYVYCKPSPKEMSNYDHLL